jgi:hypothetical protein
MTSLTGKKPKDTYKDLLQVSNSNSGIDSTIRFVSDGEGTNSVLKLSTTAVTVAADITVTGTVLVTGDTAAGDDAAIGYTSAEGIIITGQGSTNDITVKNDADGEVFGVPTGTTGVTFKGVIRTDDATDSTSGSSGSIQTDGGIGAVKEIVTDATFQPLGDTAASDKAAIGYTSGEGIIITGQGSTNDVTIKNDADAAVISIPTGGTNVTIAGDLTISGDDLFMGTNTSGAALIADGTNFNPVVISSDATIATNGALTIANDAVTLAKMAGLVRGKIIYGDSSGDPAALTVGSNGQVLKSDGTDISWGSSPAVVTSYTNSTDNRVITSVDSATINGEANLTFDGSVLAVTGNVTTTGTVEPAGDTSSGDNAAIGYTSAEGIIITGQGSTNDVTIKNDADADVITIPTGATNVTIAGDLTISGDDLFMGTNTSGAALIADGTNFNPVVISGDAAIATNGALTIADNAVSLAKMAGLTRGKIIYGDASGDPAALTVGSNGYFLKSDGTDIAWASTTSAAISSYTNAGDNRVITSVDGSTVNGEANLSFDGSTLAVTGNVTATGTVEPAGDTASGDNAAFGYTSVLGAIITGQGSTNDVTLVNDADGTVLGIPTGTTNVEIAGSLTLGTDLSVANGGTGASTFTANSCLLGNGTSSFQAIAPSTSGNVLTSNGSTWASTAAGGGDFIHLSGVAASNTATISFTGISSTYTTYIFYVSNLKPATDDQQLWMRTSTNGGSSYDSGGSDYQWGGGVLANGGYDVEGSTGDSKMVTLGISSIKIGSATAGMVTGTIQLGNPSNSSIYTGVFFDGGLVSGAGGSAYRSSTTGYAQRMSAADVDAVRFQFGSGNITSGRIDMYGLKT